MDKKFSEKQKKKGLPHKQYVDEIVEGIKELWKKLDISYDDFIRTTEERHKQVVEKIFEQIT